MGGSGGARVRPARTLTLCAMAHTQNNLVKDVKGKDGQDGKDGKGGSVKGDKQGQDGQDPNAGKTARVAVPKAGSPGFHVLNAPAGAAPQASKTKGGKDDQVGGNILLETRRLAHVPPPWTPPPLSAGADCKKWLGRPFARPEQGTIKGPAPET